MKSLSEKTSPVLNDYLYEPFCHGLGCGNTRTGNVWHPDASGSKDPDGNDLSFLRFVDQAASTYRYTGLEYAKEGRQVSIQLAVIKPGKRFISYYK